jgi:hypothetical protein
MEERRRSPRRPVQGQAVAVLSIESVRVLELSTASVLLQTPFTLDPERRGVLRLSMGGDPFAADVEILRISPAPSAADGVRVAAQFLGMTPKNRQLIERFISQ